MSARTPLKDRIARGLGTGLGVLILVLVIGYGLFRLWSVLFWDGPGRAGTACRMNFFCKSSNCSKLTATARPDGTWEFGAGGRGYCTAGCTEDADCRRSDLRCITHKGKSRCVRVTGP